MCNSFGKNFKITTFGESHGKGLGVIVDGCPSGIAISLNYINNIIRERRTAQNKYTTKRAEPDSVEILSGIYQGKTLGTPITLVVFNKDNRSDDYDNLKHNFRPSHADYTWFNKFQHIDHRGGGRSSARETVARVLGAAIAYKILEQFNIKIYGFISEIYGISINYNNIDYNYINQNHFYSPDPSIIECWEKLLTQAIEEGDSLGGVIDIRIKGCPVGLGNPVFDKLNSRLAEAIFSVPAVKGLEFGAGFQISKMKGSQANDSIYAEKGKVGFKTNNNGGILGGISNGDDITMRIAMKPTSSISKPQQTINSSLENVTIEIKGRHDPCLAIRAVSVCKSMCTLVLADFLLEKYNKS